MIRIGILGAADVAPYALIEPVSLRDDCTISVVACRDKERGEAFAAQYNIPAVETDYMAVLRRSDVDLVYNALPPSRHADLSIAALDAGKPVLCEKPFAMNAVEAQKMADASERTGVPLIEGFHYRYHPAFSRLLEIINQGEIGEIVRIHALFTAPSKYRKGELRHTLAVGGGSLMDMGCYPVHWTRMIMGREPVVHTADCLTKQDPQIDITTRAELHFSDGITADVECSMDISRPFNAELTIWGTNGYVRFDNPLSPHTGHLISIGKNETISTEQVNVKRTYDYQLEHVLDVLAGRSDPIGGGGDAVANMAVIDAIYQAAGLNPR